MRYHGDYDRAIEYQLQIAGWKRFESGGIPAYQQISVSTGQSVMFDGHTFRGPNRLEVFLTAKYDYEILAADDTGIRERGIVSDILMQAQRELDAIPDDAILEWHVSNTYGAAAIDRLFRTEGLRVKVYYTPELAS